MNRQDTRAMDVILRKRQKSVINSITPETEKLWKQAQEFKQWLVGDPIKVPSGQSVDFSMFDFIISTMRIKASDTYLQILHSFWIEMHPYMDNVIGNLSYYQDKIKEIYGIEGDTLRNFAIQNLELQCHRLFLKESLDNLLGEEEAKLVRDEFKKFHGEFEVKSDKEIAKIKKREEKWMKDMEKREAKKQKEAKRRAFATSLR